MTKTFKKCFVFFVPAAFLIVARMALGSTTLSDNILDWTFSGVVQIVGMGVIPLCLHRACAPDEKISDAFRLKFKINPLYYLFAASLGLLMPAVLRAASALWMSALILAGYAPPNSVGTVYSGPEVLVLTLICTAVLPGIFEELTYRGLGFSVFSNGKNDNAAVLITAALFALGHQNVPQTGYAFVAGVAIGYLSIKSGSVVPGMIVHFMNNGIGVAVDCLTQRSPGARALFERVNDAFFGGFSIFLTCAIAAALTIGILYAANLVSKKEKRRRPADGAVFFDSDFVAFDDLFGASRRSVSGMKEAEAEPEWHEYAFVYAAGLMMILTTTFTYVWGVT